MSLAEELRKLIDTPDDLSTLPALVDKLSAFEKQASENETMYQMRVKNLQDANRNYLAMLPVEQEKPKTPESELPTFEDAQAYLYKVATGGK